MAHHTIRRAEIADLERAARVRAVSWQQAFRGVLPDAMLDGFVESAWTSRLVTEWSAAIRSGGTVWLGVDDDDTIIGVAQSQADDDPDAPAPVRLSKLYLLDGAKGTGLAAQLLDHTVGTGAAYLWVLDGNERAQAFYRKHGFERDGASLNLEDDLAHVREVRMVRGSRR